MITDEVTLTKTPAKFDALFNCISVTDFTFILFFNFTSCKLPESYFQVDKVPEWEQTKPYFK